MAGASSSRDHSRPVELRDKQTVLEERVEFLTNELAAKDDILDEDRECRKTLERQLDTLRQTGVEASAELLEKAAGLDAAELVLRDAREEEIVRLEADLDQFQRSQRGSTTTCWTAWSRRVSGRPAQTILLKLARS